jgi:hypothetical protein
MHIAQKSAVISRAWLRPFRAAFLKPQALLLVADLRSQFTGSASGIESVLPSKKIMMAHNIRKKQNEFGELNHWQQD